MVRARYDGHADWYDERLTEFTGGVLPLLLELSADQLRVARRRSPESPLALASAESLPFADGRFDLVLMAFIHTDLDDRPAAVAEASGVLRPGGTAAPPGHPSVLQQRVRALPGRQRAASAAARVSGHPPDPRRASLRAGPATPGGRAPRAAGGAPQWHRRRRADAGAGG